MQEQFHDCTFLLFNGPRRSGKDEAKDTIYANMYHVSFDALSVSITFADVLWDAVPALYGITREEWECRYETDDKDKPWDKLFGLSQREAIIKLAEDHMKTLHGQDVFSNIIINRILDIRRFNIGPIYFLMDTGFDGEFTSFVDMVGRHRCFLLQIERPGCDFVGDSRHYISQQAAEGVTTYKLRNYGTLDDWRKTVKETLPLLR